MHAVGGDGSEHMRYHGASYVYEQYIGTGQATFVEVDHCGGYFTVAFICLERAAVSYQQ